MTALLVLLCLLSLTSVVSSALVLFQRWEDRADLDRLRLAVKDTLAHLDRQAATGQEQEAMIGKTWLPTAGDQARVEQLLSRQGQTRQHARTGSDPFGSSVNLAP